MQVHYRPQGIFHTVIQGQCYLREGGSDDLVLLQAGDGVAFPTGGAHWISDTGFRKAVDNFLTEEREHVSQDIEWIEQHSPFRSTVDLSAVRSGRIEL